MILKEGKMIKENTKIECKVFNRPDYCLYKIFVDCERCNKQISKEIDCQGCNSADNYKEDKKE